MYSNLGSFVKRAGRGRGGRAALLFLGPAPAFGSRHVVALEMGRSQPGWWETGWGPLFHPETGGKGWGLAG